MQIIAARRLSLGRGSDPIGKLTPMSFTRSTIGISQQSLHRRRDTWCPQQHMLMMTMERKVLLIVFETEWLLLFEGLLISCLADEAHLPVLVRRSPLCGGGLSMLSSLLDELVGPWCTYLLVKVIGSSIRATGLVGLTGTSRIPKLKVLSEFAQI